MTALTDHTASPEWAQARADWRALADAVFTTLLSRLDGADGGPLGREELCGPMHDMGGLAPVFDYILLGKMARALMEMLRQAPDPIDPSTRSVARTYLVAMSALHARDVRGPNGADGDAILAELAAIPTRG